MTSLPPSLLEQLLSELSTLASVYHKPPESFVGKGRFGADEIQRAAIQEQRQNAEDNPIAASVAAAAGGAAGANGAQGNGIENLLDIDFDGAAPASAEQGSGMAGVGTPDRVASPSSASAAPSTGMADMMGLFDMGGPASGSGAAPAATQSPSNDIMSGFAGLDLSGNSAPPPPSTQLGINPSTSSAPVGGAQKPSSGQEDLLGLF